MRHALVLAPARFALPAPGAIFGAAEPVGPMCATLSRGGHRIVVVSTTPELELDFERALGGIGETDDLLVFLAAETGTAEGPVSVCIAPGLVLGLRAMSDAVLARDPASVLFFIEACHDGEPDDTLLGAEHVDAIIRALDARARGFAVLVGVRPAARAVEGAWPFSRRLVYALQDPEARDASGEAHISRVVERFRVGRVDDGQVQSFAFVRGRSDYLLAPAPPPAPASAPVEGPTPSPPPSSARRPPPSSPPSSMPALEPLLDLADGARARGAWEEALAGYKAALMVAPHGDTDARAGIYARVGEVKRAQGKPREAELNYEKALGADPGMRAALDALVELAFEGHELRRAVEWRRKRLEVHEDDTERVAELRGIAALLFTLGDPRAATGALEEGHALLPSDPQVARALLEAYEALGQWPRVVEILVGLAGAAPGASERAALRFAAADVALGRMRDEDRGIALLQAALEDEPTHDKALQALVAVRTARGEWAALDADYARMIERFANKGDADRAWEVCRKLGVLRREKTRDVPGALEAFAGAVRCKPTDADARAMLADMHLAAGDEPEAVLEFERIARIAPVRASTYARLLALHQRAGRADRALLSAMALEELGAADVDAQLVVDQFRPDSPVRPSRPLDDGAWGELLAAQGSDDVVGDVLTIVLDAAVAARVEELKKSGKLLELDPARRQGEGSTVSAVRSFHWAAQVLGVAPPALYVMDDVPGGVAAVQQAEPTAALGPDVLRGQGAKGLAFLAARHLTYYRREHYALVHYPTLPELSALFLGAVKLALPEVAVPAPLVDAVATMRKRLARHLSDEASRALTRSVERLDERDGRVDLAAWMRSVELTAHRAGLLLCGDLRTVMTQIRAETRALADVDLEQKRSELLACCASERFAKARAMLGIEVKR